MVGRRRNLLAYLKKKDLNRYKELITRLGLRKYNDAEYQGEAKPVWMTYQKAGTDAENEYFEQYLQRIGIDSWEGIIQKIP